MMTMTKLASRPSAPMALWVVTMALWLGGCPSSLRPASPLPGSVSPNAPVIPPTAEPPATPPPHQNHLTPATLSLVTQSHSLVSRGDLVGASSTLDRALRIQPNNPLLWVELGRLRLVESDAHQAEVCGRKALALASGDRSAQAQSGRLLADALRTQQRNQEAIEVERQPFMR